jgi:hypothetical protein
MFLVLAMLLVSSSASRPALAASPGHATAKIEAVLQDPQIIQRVSAWGVSMQDIRHDISTMSVAQRAQLAAVLSRRWRGSQSHSAADLQAQFLVMMSLMRESALYASIVSSGRSRFLR